MQNNHIKCYEIGNVTFTVDTPVPYEDMIPYNLFLSHKTKTSEHYSFLYVDDLPTEVGKLVYKDNYLSIFQVNGEQHRFLYSGTNRKVYAYTAISSNCEKHAVMLNKDAPELWSGLVFASLGIEHILARHSHMILHASYINVGGTAVLFTAPCETGKSTQAELWRQFLDAEIINEDRVCISVENNIVMAHGLPFAGTSDICFNQSLPIRAIIQLSQAENNHLQRLSGMTAFKALYSGCWLNTWNKNDVERISTLISNIVLQIPIYHLACLPDKTAVELLSKVIL